jgi:lysozyme family protein
MATYAYASLEAEYTSKWGNMVITPARVSTIDTMARKIIAGKQRYKAVQSDTGVPWAFIGVLHSRESSCDFAGVLHNGEKIIGNGKKTKLVPAGRGPFSTWEQAAIDALEIKGYKRGSPEWSIPRCLYEGERFNGFGYRNRGVPSAYLWSFSNQYSKGKYIADGVWSSTAVDQQMGIAPLMSRLLALDVDVWFGGRTIVEEPAQPDDETLELQRTLNDLDYNLPLTGIYDDATRAAVKTFQTKRGLKADGLAGPLTNAKLVEALRAKIVLEAQTKLASLGYNPGPLDGIMGKRTRSAIGSFQARSGLPQTGELDEVTLTALEA